MPDAKDLQQRMQRISSLIQEAGNTPGLQSVTRELVQSLMDLHGAGLERIMEILFQAGDPGQRLIDDLGRDPLVSSLLVLYGLHPEPLEARVQSALEQVRPKLRYQGGDVELLEMRDGSVHLRLTVAEHSCGSTARTLQSTIEEALYEAAPDMTSLVIEGLEEKPSSGFISLEKLAGSAVLTPQPAPVGAGND